MKKILFATLLIITAFTTDCNAQSWIRVNQAGYLPGDVKVAVCISLDSTASDHFEVVDALSLKVVFKGIGTKVNAKVWGMKSAYRMNFSSVQSEGGYYITSNGVKSPVFRISADSYKGLSDLLLVYMRQQRCYDNPYTGEICHADDGYIVNHPTRNGEKIDARGGWHDATDYLQYQTTSGAALYQMMFAWQQQKDKSVFKDFFDARGRKGSNGIPDILDEIRWGMDWMLRMNP
ncbi:MAG: glycoside hydrolase family 9 protein, partial [Bacteroidales bacterium]|nr:glycoside hydrolase family 9 protein [Bacteroidales bacterium]